MKFDHAKGNILHHYFFLCKASFEYSKICIFRRFFLINLVNIWIQVVGYD